MVPFLHTAASATTLCYKAVSRGAVAAAASYVCMQCTASLCCQNRLHCSSANKCVRGTIQLLMSQNTGALIHNSCWCSAELLHRMRQYEREHDIEPDWNVHAFQKAQAIQGQQSSVATEYVIRMLGLDICADTICGNHMMRGISGGQKKRVTSGRTSPACQHCGMHHVLHGNTLPFCHHKSPVLDSVHALH